MTRLGTSVMKTQSKTLDLKPRGESLWSKALQRFLRHRLAMSGLIVLVVMVGLAVFAPVAGRYSPIELDLGNMKQPPNATHWLGTDTTGRDVWSRTLHAGRVSLSVGLVAVVL